MDSVLYVEGTSIVPEMATFYSTHRAGNPVDVIRDTIAPVPDIFHVAFSAEVSDQLRQFAERHAVAEMFDHLKAYRGDVLLFTFHDAFDGWLRISGRVPEALVAQFGQTLEASCRREETKKRDPEQLRRILEAFEHPERVKIRVARESWPQRIRRWFTR